jgi:hypothetical protein
MNNTTSRLNFNKFERGRRISILIFHKKKGWPFGQPFVSSDAA